MMQEGGARMVKLESGAEQIRIVEFLAGTTSPSARIWGSSPIGAQDGAFA